MPQFNQPTNFILYIQLTGYCIAAILSLCITIPMSMHQDNFKGHCLLFTTGEWREKNDIDRAEGIDPKGFFMQMFTAQFGVWLSWATWCGLTVFALLKLCRYHQQENIRVK